MGLSERQIPRVGRRRAGHRPATSCDRSADATSAAKREDVVADEALLPKLRVLFVTEDDPLYVIRFFDIFFAEYPREEHRNLRHHDRPGVSRTDVEDAAAACMAFMARGGLFRQGLRFIDARLRGRSIASLASIGGSAPCPGAIGQSAGIHRPSPRHGAGRDRVRRSAGGLQARASRRPAARLHQHPFRAAADVSWHDADLLADAARGASRNDHSAPHGREARCGRRAGDTGFRHQDIRFSRPGHQGTKCEGARLVIRVLLDLRAGRTQPSPLDMIDAHYFSFPKPEHVREFRKRGHRLL